MPDVCAPVAFETALLAEAMLELIDEVDIDREKSVVPAAA